jgi:hypothetical protein
VIIVTIKVQILLKNCIISYNISIELSTCNMKYNPTNTFLPLPFPTALQSNSGIPTQGSRSKVWGRVINIWGRSILLRHPCHIRVSYLLSSSGSAFASSKIYPDLVLSCGREEPIIEASHLLWLLEFRLCARSYEYCNQEGANRILSVISVQINITANRQDMPYVI